MYKLGKNTLRNLESILDSKDKRSIILFNAVKSFIKITPIDFCIISNGGYRTAYLQKQLFLKGFSKCDGFNVLSKHQLGLAVDLVPWVNNKATWETKHTFYLSGAFMSFCNDRNLPIRSGADWNKDGDLQDGWDPCHMEIVNF